MEVALGILIILVRVFLFTPRIPIVTDLQGIHDEKRGDEAGIVVFDQAAGFEIINRPNLAGVVGVSAVFFVTETHSLDFAQSNVLGRDSLMRRLILTVVTESHKGGGDFIC